MCMLLAAYCPWLVQHAASGSVETSILTEQLLTPPHQDSVSRASSPGLGRLGAARASSPAPPTAGIDSTAAQRLRHLTAQGLLSHSVNDSTQGGMWRYPRHQEDVVPSRGQCATKGETLSSLTSSQDSTAHEAATWSSSWVGFQRGPVLRVSVTGAAEVELHESSVASFGVGHHL
mmetsp:Transcript_17499/g.30033  ORF Transcript_17499/g.30033 Transcript_17499/m.30033 type:complete len:175 (+) Transcript_17499:267-791(+)